MSEVKTWFSAAELAGLPGLPKTESGTIRFGKNAGWDYRTRQGRGGGREYAIKSVLESVKDADRSAIINALWHKNPIQPNLPAPTAAHEIAAAKTANRELSRADDRQKIVAGARAIICRHIVERAQFVAQEHVINALCIASRDADKLAQLPAELQQAIRLAKAKKRGEQGLYKDTVKKWLGRYQRNGVDALLPSKPQKDLSVPREMLAVLQQFQQPQKPSLTVAVEAAARDLGIAADDMPRFYHRARRFLQKVAAPDLMRGRMGSRELKTMLPFVRRDTDVTLPGDIYTADGHTFDAEVAHPKHGRPFRPEITTVLDVCTRKVVGWSIDLAESGFAVLHAFSHAVESHGIPLIFYVDNGSGYRNAMMSDPAIGLMGRLGVKMEHSIAYNSQARGLIERVHQSIWVRGAKMLPTYMGAPMDREAKQAAYKITRSAIKATGTSRLLMAWPDFLAWCTEQVAAYNARSHTGLPKFRGASGRLQHRSPDEHWQARVAEGQIARVTPDEARHLFRPQTKCKVLQGEVRLFNNIYFSRDLTPYHGDTVRVGYDIHDPQTVWVYDHAGRVLAEAQWNANRRAYFPESVLETQARKRAEGRIARAEAKIEEAEAELNPPALIEQQTTLQIPVSAMDQPVFIDHFVPGIEAAEPLIDEKVVAIETAKRPRFQTDPEKYRWLMQHKDEWTSHDAGWLRQYVESWPYEDLLERYAYQGVAWTEQDDARLRGLEEAVSRLGDQDTAEMQLNNR